MSKRIYYFDVPINVPGWKIGLGREQIENYPGYSDAPEDLRQRIAETTFSSTLEITEDDLNRLPDELWERMAADLQLDWAYEPPEEPQDLGPSDEEA